jgi:hypothetical protein
MRQVLHTKLELKVGRRVMYSKPAVHVPSKEQIMSLLRVAWRDIYEPLGHSAITGKQSLEFETLEYVEPRVQGSQTWSEVAVGARPL